MKKAIRVFEHIGVWLFCWFALFLSMVVVGALIWPEDMPEWYAVLLAFIPISFAVLRILRVEGYS